MFKRLLIFLKVPAAIRTEYWRESIQKNSLSLLVVCIIVFGAELYNIARVLFWSHSGLGTVNNRIYFFMYCALLAIAAVWLLLQRSLRTASLKAQWGAQYAVILLMLLWHVCLNAYDLMQSPDAGTAIFTTAILGLGVFIQMPSPFSAIGFGLGYGVFLLMVGPILDAGAKINLTITFTVALAVSFTSSHHAVVSLTQRQEISQINAQLAELVQKDPLTGLLNKAAFQRRAAQALMQADAAHPLALAILDLDDFKAVNDSCGHPCGDYVLMETALKLRTVYSGIAEIGRIGGDEFAVLLPACRDRQLIEALGRQLIQEISGMRWHGRLLDTQCSIGICQVRQPGVSYEQLYQEADSALYEAKGSGKGCCRFHILDNGKSSVR